MNHVCSGVIVVVEDEEDTRELLRELLEERGHAVLTAEDGIAGIDAMNSAPRVCAVILDLVMPRMDGLAVLAAMATDLKLSALPVCVSSSSTERAPEGVFFLAKPVDLHRLYAFVDESCTRAA
jgi:CheY-like chemotaxis protein